MMEPTLIKKDKIENIAKKYNLKLVLLFGSQVTGKISEEGDIDIAILSEKNLSFNEEINLATELIGTFENVDMTDLRKAPPLLLKEIIENCRVLYEKNKNEFEKLEVYALQRYAEAGPIFDMHKEGLRKFIQKYD